MYIKTKISSLNGILSNQLSMFVKLLVCCVFLFSTTNAGTVSFDTTFNGSGYRIQSINTSGAIGESVKVQTDGKIVLGGWTLGSAVYGSFAAMRVNADGSLDTGFNNNGFVITTVANFNRGDTLLIQPDGKILLSGERYFGNTNDDFTVLRYNTDGTLDNTFDGNGISAPPVTGFSDEHSYDMALQPDGKMVLVGTTAIDDNQPTDIAIMRLNPNGSLDTTFNGTGILKVAFTNGSSSANAVVIQNDGKIVVGGFVFTGVKNDFLLMRFSSNGFIDTSFGIGGLNTISVNGSNNVISTLALQSDGKIVAGGSGHIARYTNSGIIDGTFGSGGTKSMPHTAAEILIQSGGKILVGGTNASKVNVSRLNSNGTFDTSFNNTGTFIATVPGFQCVGKSLAVQNDGKIVIGGNCNNGSVSRFAVFRFQEAPVKTLYDYDGDGKSDVSVFRPSNGSWYISNSSNGAFSGAAFGASTDPTAPADYDGDGKTDIAVFRPSNGTWYLQQTANGFSAVAFGQNGDLPVPADYDGDGKADVAVYRPSNGTWYRLNSSNSQFVGVQFGLAEDKPTLGDFDGDGKADIAVFRPSNGTWYRLNSSNGSFSAAQFGFGTDKIVPADYDGDGKTDISVFRPSNGTWYRLNSSDASFAAFNFGLPEDKPVPADYDGDGRADIAVYRPSNGTWYLSRSTNGFAAQQFGSSEDIPTPNAFIR